MQFFCATAVLVSASHTVSYSKILPLFENFRTSADFGRQAGFDRNTVMFQTNFSDAGNFVLCFFTTVTDRLN